MNIVGIVVNEEAFNILDDMDEVGAFVNGEIRGSSQPVYVPELNAYLLFLTVYANETGETISLKYYDASRDEVTDVEESFVFGANQVIGTVDLPQPLSLLDAVSSHSEQLANAATFNIYPNPASERVYLSFWASANTPVNITITDALGRQIDEMLFQPITGRNVIEWTIQQQLPQGLYFFRLRSDGQSDTRAVELKR
jgi:hypothetical protein